MYVCNMPIAWHKLCSEGCLTDGSEKLIQCFTLHFALHFFVDLSNALDKQGIRGQINIIGNYLKKIANYFELARGCN